MPAAASGRRAAPVARAGSRGRVTGSAAMPMGHRRAGGGTGPDRSDDASAHGPEGLAGAVTLGQVAEIQRSRLLAGAIAAVAECGYTGVTVAYITSRARVSRRTFYELFANCEDCLTAALEDVMGLIAEQLAEAELGGLPWRERVRGALWVILCFFDREPELAQLCVVQALRGGSRVIARREEILEALATVVDEGRNQGVRGRECTAMTAEGLVGAAMAIVHARLVRGEPALRDLLGELMGMIVLPYLGPAAARREQARPAPALAKRDSAGATAAVRVGGDPLDGVEMRLTYRTARVLEGVAELPGANNRQVAELAGIQDQGQVSKLLARLQRLELLVNAGEGHPKGEPNAWSLTPKGQRVAQSIRAHALDGREAA